MTDLGLKILALEMKPNDADAATIKDYLISLLRDVWIYEEGFDGKRPFGNSGWQQEVYKTLYDNGVISGIINRWEEVEYDPKEADPLIYEAIDSL